MKILVIEDEAFSAMVTVAFFKDFGHDVEHATTAEEALSSLAHTIPDVVVSDWSIEGGNSVVPAIKEIRKINPEAKIAFVTGHSRDRLEPHLHEIEPYFYFTKPVNFEILVKELTE